MIVRDMREMIHELISTKELLLIITWRDIKIRYKQSIMGFMWAILMPLMIVAAGIIVKLGFSIVSGKPMNLSDLASISVKALPWSFFIASVRFATNSLTSNSNLVSKIYFPREIFPISAVLANLFDFFVASIFLTIVLAIARIGISFEILWLPLLLGLLIIFTIGLGMFLSCANLFFRDVKYIVEVFLTFAIFFTPVFYESSLFGKFAPLLLINPVGCILEAINSVVVLHHQPNLLGIGYSGAFSILTLICSWFIFNRAEYLFAERI